MGDEAHIVDNIVYLPYAKRSRKKIENYRWINLKR